VRHADGAELGIGDQALPPGEDLFEEVFGNLLLGGKVEAA
jgi:hypothetical protein